MGARYPFYLLADSREGQEKEAEVGRTAPSSQSTSGRIRLGFVYERVSHITLKAIANNAEIDVIWEKWQVTLEPLREKLNATLKKQWQEREIPREADAKWPDLARATHADWWQARIARQAAGDIDRSHLPREVPSHQHEVLTHERTEGIGGSSRDARGIAPPAHDGSPPRIPHRRP